MAKSIKTILVTGGAGFVGSNLCIKLLQSGARVICVDEFSTGRLTNIEKFKNHKNFKLVKGDVTKPLNFKVDEIYNLACPASPPAYQRDAIKTSLTNILGTLNCLNLAKKTKAKMLQASTSEIYGDPLEHPQKESYWGNVNPVGIRSCYDEGKRMAETLCMDFYRQYGVEIKIVRIFNTYGPGMAANDGRVVSNFITQALSNKPLTVYGKGSQTRSFQYIDDLIAGLIAAMAAKKTFTGPVNLGNPAEFSVLDLAKKVLKMTGSKSKIIYKALPSDDPKQRKPDISLAKKALNWQPKVTLEDGLRKTINYFKK